VRAFELRDAAAVKIGTHDVKATRCDLDGDPLVYDSAVFQAGLAVTSSGDLAVLDGDGNLRAFHVEKGKACTLRLDHTFGTDGVLALGHGATSKNAHLDAGRDGDLYISLPDHHPLRIHRGVASEICDADATVLASPRADGIWLATTDLAHANEGCGHPSRVTLAGWSWRPSVWVLDDRLAAAGEAMEQYRIAVHARDGRKLFALDDPSGSQTWAASRITRCGSSICGLGGWSLALWTAHGKLVGSADVTDLAPVSGPIVPIDLAAGSSGTYLLFYDNDSAADGHRRAAMIVRLDGLP
jgi:hypothetical protein